MIDFLDHGKRRNATRAIEIGVACEADATPSEGLRMSHSNASGPLQGLRVVEFATVGPVTLCGMLLADAGATVLRIDRAGDVDLGTKRPARFDLMRRGRMAVVLDLKTRQDQDTAREIVRDADVLLEGFRPGVMERLRLGPDECLELQPRLVYGRMTGWGQDGPLAHAAGHDINYVAITGALHSIGRRGAPPSIPLNVLGDFGGGAMFLAFGVLAAVHEAARSGRGQVVDASVADGVLSLMTMVYGMRAAGLWQCERGTNTIDSGSPSYDVYECADGQWVAIGAIEKRFYDQLLAKLELDPASVPDRAERANWPALRELLAARFRTRTQQEWCERLEGTDCCFAPVLDLDSAKKHAHLRARGAFEERDGVVQPAPAPRFGRTPGAAGPVLPRATGQDALLQWWGRERFEQVMASGPRSA